MHVTAVRHLAVPTGTAAATVIAREPSADPTIESRRFLRLESLPDIAFRAHFEELIVSGVYTVLHDRLLVLRVIGGGTRRFAVVASESAGETTTYPRAGLESKPQVTAVAAAVTRVAAFDPSLAGRIDEAATVGFIVAALVSAANYFTNNTLTKDVRKIQAVVNVPQDGWFGPVTYTEVRKAIPVVQ